MHAFVGLHEFAIERGLEADRTEAILSELPPEFWPPWLAERIRWRESDSRIDEHARAACGLPEPVR
jgi:hypothetical protein